MHPSHPHTQGRLAHVTTSNLCLTILICGDGSGHDTSTKELTHRSESISASLQRRLEQVMLLRAFNLLLPDPFDRFISWLTDRTLRIFRISDIQTPLMEGMLAHEMNHGKV